MIDNVQTHFDAPLELKSVSEDGVFEGYASLFNREDLAHDVILPGAFRESLARRGATGVKLLYQHDPREPVGVWSALREDVRGLFARGRLLLDVRRARDVLALMQAGALDGLSIGFHTLSARRDAKTGLRRVFHVDLLEISVVTFPMLPDARITRLGDTAAHDSRMPSRSSTHHAVACRDDRALSRAVRLAASSLHRSCAPARSPRA